MRRKPDETFFMARDRYFDRRFGVDTAGCVELEDMSDVSEEAKVNMVEYRPTPATDLAMAISDALLPWSQDTVRSATFIDLGCGKGRGLLVAGQFPFKSAVGFELSPSIAEAADENLAKTRVRPVCGSLSVVCDDASQAELPDTPLFIYMFNPFDAPIVRIVEERLRESIMTNPRPIIVLYANAQHADVFRRSSVWDSRDVGDSWWAVFDGILPSDCSERGGK